jgi:hypothetical protein
MMRGSGRQTRGAPAVVSREYRADPSSCDRALQLLLKEGRPTSRPERPERIKDDPAKVSIPE